VSNPLQAKLDHLEILYTEQDHLIQVLNDRVAQQDQEISRLQLNIEHIKVQLQTMTSELTSNINLEAEKPPHY